MSPAAEVTFAVLGGGAALTAISAGLVKLFRWALAGIIREEVTPIVDKFTTASTDLTKQMGELQKSFEISQKAQELGTAEMHDAVRAIRERLDEHDTSIADNTLRLGVLEERTNWIGKENG